MFFVVTIVQLIISFVAAEDEEADMMACAKCFITGDCTYKFKNETTKECPEGTKPNANKTFCIEK